MPELGYFLIKAYKVNAVDSGSFSLLLIIEIDGQNLLQVHIII